MIPIPGKVYVALAIFAVGVSTGFGVNKVFSDRKISELKLEAAKKEAAVEKSLAEERAKNLKLKETWDAAAQIERDDYEDHLKATHDQLDTALASLRDARSARAALRPTQDAPASCGAFQAPPAQLSPENAELALRLAAEADEVVEERNLCVNQYNKILKAFNGR